MYNPKPLYLIHPNIINPKPFECRSTLAFFFFVFEVVEGVADSSGDSSCFPGFLSEGMFGDPCLGPFLDLDGVLGVRGFSFWGDTPRLETLGDTLRLRCFELRDFFWDLLWLRCFELPDFFGDLLWLRGLLLLDFFGDLLRFRRLLLREHRSLLEGSKRVLLTLGLLECLRFEDSGGDPFSRSPGFVFRGESVGLRALVRDFGGVWVAFFSAGERTGGLWNNLRGSGELDSVGAKESCMVSSSGTRSQYTSWMPSTASSGTCNHLCNRRLFCGHT